MYDTLTIAVILLPILIWAAFTIICWGKVLEMDNGLGNGSFFGIFSIYRRLAYTIFGVALLAALAAADKQWPPAAIICGAAAIYAFLFNGWAAYSYESYLHAKTVPPQGIGKSNYSAMKYALTLSLGVSAIVLFVTGIMIFLQTVLER